MGTPGAACLFSWRSDQVFSFQRAFGRSFIKDGLLKPLLGHE
jgi:hypothetical protein